MRNGLPAKPRGPWEVARDPRGLPSTLCSKETTRAFTSSFPGIHQGHSRRRWPRHPIVLFPQPDSAGRGVQRGNPVGVAQDKSQKQPSLGALQDLHAGLEILVANKESFGPGTKQLWRPLGDGWVLTRGNGHAQVAPGLSLPQHLWEKQAKAAAAIDSEEVVTAWWLSEGPS
ncbi:hypothetical protein H1C71_008018 [Ictidomys tridecemlineatus]|nr:hypothetical protein H1C71_008018 [Ictidomys tridecemlineatus]KAG3284419.1 hypothetical protein H1C71_008018 [Ictidomys tridecemlineatus]KAG3284420.1 hypothetical protein H1C71_008018 [Ictidomys tridecemlineatus]